MGPANFRTEPRHASKRECMKPPPGWPSCIPVISGKKLTNERAAYHESVRLLSKGAQVRDRKRTENNAARPRKAL